MNEVKKSKSKKREGQVLNFFIEKKLHISLKKISKARGVTKTHLVRCFLQEMVEREKSK